MATPSTPPAQRPPPDWQRFGVALLALLFVAWPFFAAAPTRTRGAVGADLVMDGQELVMRNPHLVSIARGEGGFGRLVTSDWWGGARPVENQYRPLASALVGAATLVAGEPYDPAAPGRSPLPYKLFVLALHAVGALLVIELAWRLFGKAPHAIAAGLLWIASPVHGAVIFDAGSIALQLGLVLALGSMVAWFVRGPLVAAALAVLAALSHEIGFLVAPLLFVLEIGRQGEGGFADGVRHAASRLGGVGVVAVGSLVAFAARWAAVGSPFVPADIVDPLWNPLIGSGSRALDGLRLAAASIPALVGLDPTASRVFGGSPDHSLGQVTALGLGSLWNWVASGLLIGAIGAAIALFPRCRTRGALALAVLASAILVSNAVLPLPRAFATSLLVVPLVFFALFLAPFLGRLGRSGVAIALVAALAGGTWLHVESRHWMRPGEVWQHVADVTARRSARAQLELGRRHLADLLPSMGQNRLERAATLAPTSPAVFAVLARARSLNTDPLGAANALRQAVELTAARTDHRWTEHSERADPAPGALLFRANEIELQEGAAAPADHLAWLDQLLERGWESPYVELYRARTFIALDRPAEAERALRRSIEIKPMVENVRSLGRLLSTLGRGDEALRVYSEYGPLVGGAGAAEAELLLHRAGATLATDPREALAIAQRVLAMQGDIEGEQVFQARLVSSQARLDLLPSDPFDAARERRLAIEDLQMGLVAYQAATADTYFATHALARLLFEQGDGERARDLLNASLQYREAPTQRMLLGILRMHADQHEDAVRQLELARAGLVRDGVPVDEGLYVTTTVSLLRSLAELGDEGEAARSAILADRESPAQREAIARHLAVSGQASEAVALARTIAERPAIRQWLPAFERAIELDAVLAADPTNVEARMERSSVRLVLGDPYAAARDARLAVERAPAGRVRGRASQFLAQARRAQADTRGALDTLREALDERDVPDTVREQLQRQAELWSAEIGPQRD